MEAIDIDVFNPAAKIGIEAEEQTSGKIPRPPAEVSSSSASMPISATENTPISEGNTSKTLTESERVLTFHLAKKKKSKYQVKLATHHTGTWYDWRYDEFDMTLEKLDRMIENFKAKVVHPSATLERQVPLQAGHGFLDEPPALGWLTELEIDDQGVLWGTYDLTEDGLKLLEGDAYAFVSPKYDEQYTSQQIIDGKRTIFGATLIHLALTNSPVLAELPQIALSKTPMSLDVGVYHPREELMTQPAGEGTETVVTPPATTPSPPDKQAGTELTQTPPAATPAVVAPASDRITLSKSEWEEHQATVKLLTERMEREARRNHEMSVESIIKEAAGRGVPPAVLDLAKPIMVASHPEAPKSITLSKADEEKDEVNIFEAMQRLLESIPVVALGQKTPEVGGKHPSGETKKMTAEEAEAAGREYWKKQGVVREPSGTRN